LLVPVVSTTECALIADLISRIPVKVSIPTSIPVSVSALASVSILELVSRSILGFVPIRVLPIGDPVVIVVTQSVTDTVSVFIHKHQPVLVLKSVLGFRLNVILVAISRLTRAIRKNKTSCQDQYGPGEGKKKSHSHFNLLDEC
jgi:hypothetical protein